MYWLKEGPRLKSSWSTIWRSLSNSMPIILKDLSWKVGRGIQMFIGIDLICRIADISYLSCSLIRELHARNMFVLKDISYEGDSGKWASSVVLGLSDRSAKEWDRFILALKKGNVSLNDSPDELVWMYNSKDGKVNANLAYNLAITGQRVGRIEWWMKWFWKGTLPLKIKLFAWLCLNNKILTWEGLQRRGVLGLGKCSLCYSSMEMVAHLFGNCNFFQQVWLSLMNHLHIYHCWEEKSIADNLQSYSNIKDPYTHLPLFVLWDVWKTRNASIFTNIAHKLEVIYLKIMSSLIEWGKNTLPLKGRLHSIPLLWHEHPVGFFDGVAKDRVCGAGIVIKLDNSRTFK